MYLNKKIPQTYIVTILFTIIFFSNLTQANAETKDTNKNITIKTPCAEIPDFLYDSFTKYGRIPVQYRVLDESYTSSNPIVFTKEWIKNLVDAANFRNTYYYGRTDYYLYQAIEKYLPYIKNKEIGVLGSRLPWYEAIIISFDGSPTTIEYNKIISQDDRLKVMTVDEYDKNPKKFDTLVSISSLEHDGLGRYGDPLDPDGDIKAMAKCKSMLKEGGLLFLSVPVGKDLLYWNVHRVYGEIRLPLLLDGWEIVDSFGYNEEDKQNNSEFVQGSGHQPVFVLKPKYN
ncbi:MAG: TPR domain protein [candidate division TM6 bacterium GW2011_GWF2_30_66]|jgi:hypothetical protein|nr:MAG: TPR domain protein [candidate division TM6 bacterium GW2011_GWF2_30_66]